MNPNMRPHQYGVNAFPSTTQYQSLDGQWNPFLSLSIGTGEGLIWGDVTVAYEVRLMQV